MKKKIKNTPLAYVISGLVSALLAFVVFWFMLPPLNPVSPDFWTFVIIVLVIVLVCFSVGRATKMFEMKEVTVGGNVVTVPSMKKGSQKHGWRRWILLAIGLIILFLLIGSVVGAKIFQAGSYRDLITIEEGSFSQDIAEISMNQIPIVDRDTAAQLGKRKLGTMSDLVSQFEIAEDYTQINVTGVPVRVTPLLYADFFKWWGNQSEGVPAYIKVDMATQDTELVRLPQGMKYSTSEYFMRRIDRYLRFCYPTKIFSEISFEIDDSGTPYWVASTVSYRIGIFSGTDIDGAVLVNAVTGEHQYYADTDVPTWVDRVYDASLVINQLTDNGLYQEGFLNAYFGQKNVRKPTDGYNYLAINDDVYLYTGMTSATGDQSNIGFVLVNMRTKQTKFYAVPGAEEYSAMNSAQGQVQNLKYTATFPLLLNVADRPTYFMSLKDAAGLVKMYAFVDVEQYQVVGTGNTVAEAQASYKSKLGSGGSSNQPGEVTTEEKTAVIVASASAVVEGNTQYYLRFENDPHTYTAAIGISNDLPFCTAGTTVTVKYVATAEETAARTVLAVAIEQATSMTTGTTTVAVG